MTLVSFSPPPSSRSAWEGKRQGKVLEAGQLRALTADEAVFLGQEGSLQALAAAHGPEEQHPRGERGV